MRIRTRAAAIILNNKNELLLVKHIDPDTGEIWWMLPGGGIEGAESAEEAVIREVQEECGITCIPKELVYVREYVEWEKETHHIGLFFTAEALDFNISTGIDPELPADKQFIVKTDFLTEKEVKAIPAELFPEILRDEFWNNLKSGFKGHKVYLGQQR